MDKITPPEFSLEEMYSLVSLDFVEMEIVEFDQNLKQMRALDMHHLGLAYAIHRFVDDVACGQSLSFQAVRQGTGLSPDQAWEPTELGRQHYRQLANIAGLFLPSAEFSEQVKTFLEVCRGLNLIGAVVPFDPHQLGPVQGNFRQGAEIFNRLVEELRKILRETFFNQRLLNRKNLALANYKSIAAYEDGLYTSARSSFYVTPINLGYRPDQRAVPLSTFREHLRKMLSSGKVSFFRNMRGYIKKLEYSLVKGNNAHLILFFSPDVDPRQFISEVFQHWNKITGGIGTGYHCDGSPNVYKKLPLQVVAHGDEIARNQIRRSIAYLCMSQTIYRVGVGYGDGARKAKPRTIEHAALPKRIPVRR